VELDAPVVASPLAGVRVDGAIGTETVNGDLNARHASAITPSF
jgi:hypothetical protein